jgi:hypothetical protein
LETSLAWNRIVLEIVASGGTFHDEHYGTILPTFER